MNGYIKIIGVLGVSIACWSLASAQSEKVSNDSVAHSVRMEKLLADKEDLQARIRVEDSKRNRQLPGVSKLTLEKANDRQDSICLSLRSQLTDVVLEINELTPNSAYNGLVNQFNTLVTGNKPSKPAIHIAPHK